MFFLTYSFSEDKKFSNAPPKAFGFGAESCEFEKTDGTIKIKASEFLFKFSAMGSEGFLTF